AYSLRKHEIVGVVSTGYALLRNPRPGIAPAYMVLAQNEDLGEYGLQAAQPVWQNHLVAVYVNPPERAAWLNGRAGSDGEAPLCGRDTTALNRAKFGLGDYATAQPEQPLRLYTSPGALGWAPLDGSAARRDLVLALASFTPQIAELDLGAEHRRIELPAGLSIHHTGMIDVPSAVAIRPSSAPIALRWASLESTEAPAGPAAPDQHTLLLGLHGTPRANGAQVQLQTQNSGAQLLRYAVEIYEDRAGYRDTPAHYAWALFPAPQSGSHRLDLDLAAPQIGLDGQPLHVTTGAVADGAYFAALWIYQGEQVRARLPFLRFERRGGQVTAVTPLNLNTAFVPLEEPRQPAETQFGNVVGLRGFEIDSAQAQPGGRIQASLL